MFEIHNDVKNKVEYFSTHQKEIKELLNNPYMMFANFRNRNLGGFFSYYEQIDNLGHKLILEIDNSIINHN